MIRPKLLRVAAACWLLAPLSPAGTVVLKNAFIEKFKNRATIEATFEVDHAHAKPNNIGNDGDDGDLHASGRAPEIALPMVVEVVNAAAATQKNAIDAIHQAEPAAANIPVSGAWRFWFEHPALTAQIQGQTVPKPANTNPDHCFEIHPVTNAKTSAILKSFIPIPNFQAYDAKTAFEYYETLKVTVQANDTATTINAVKAKYNYADFLIELKSTAKEVEDGYFAMAYVLDKEENTVVSKMRRMVFVKGTAPADRIRTAAIGDRFHVLGIPRVNLERISYITHKKSGQQVTTQLPYEMIIVGIYAE